MCIRDRRKYLAELCLYIPKHFLSMNENNEDINDRIISGSPIYISRIKKPALRQVFIITLILLF